MILFDSWYGTLIELYFIYKILDKIVRIPYLGHYEDKYIMITGCDTGFGNLLAKRLDKLGCHVFAGCLTESGETELRKSCSSRLTAVNLDVTKTESIQKAFQLVKDKLPPGRGLWGLMNNAGTMAVSGMPDWLTIQDYRKACDINLFGLIEGTIAFLPLVKLERGRVVSTSSIVGRLCVPYSTPYCVAKHGVEAFGDGLRRSMYPFGVKSILIEPGVHNTKFMDPEILRKQTERSWNQAPEEVRRDYGEDYFKYECAGSVDMFRSLGTSNFDGVIDAYEHALMSRFPRARYLVGKDARFLWIPLTYLPEWLSDFLMRLSEYQKPGLTVVTRKR